MSNGPPQTQLGKITAKTVRGEVGPALDGVATNRDDWRSLIGVMPRPTRVGQGEDV